MLKKLEKLENFINEVLNKIFSAIYTLIIKLIYKFFPKFVFTWILKINEKINQYKTYLIEQKNKKQTFYRENLIKQIHLKKEAFFEHIQVIQKYPLKEKSIEKYKVLKEYLFETHPKVHLYTLKAFIKKSFSRMKLFITNYNNTYTQITIISLFILISGSTLIYFGGSKIYYGEFNMRSPASDQIYDYRPNYHLYEPKTLEIINIKIPIWTENVTQIDSITIDFAIKTSTRFARHYLLEYEYKLRDHFFTNVEPFISNFPLEGEGQEILKEKIIYEINFFLQQNGVEGVIEDVYILYLVGS